MNVEAGEKDIVATLARYDGARPNGIGPVVGTYLIRVPADATDSEMVDACIEASLDDGYGPDDFPAGVVVIPRDADPVGDALLYAQHELACGATIN